MKFLFGSLGIYHPVIPPVRSTKLSSSNLRVLSFEGMDAGAEGDVSALSDSFLAHGQYVVEGEWTLLLSLQSHHDITTKCNETGILWVWSSLQNQGLSQDEKTQSPKNVWHKNNMVSKIQCLATQCEKHILAFTDSDVNFPKIFGNPKIRKFGRKFAKIHI